MSTEFVNSASIIPFPKSCGICESKGNVQLFAGLMLCGRCQENMRITNPGLFATNESIEPKVQE
ncbi:hypothetical protein MZL57_004142 [Acinetobacter baumannii]|uniref:hypothetical protein n=1 Tax=Acinetobacter baumannii TaxID=470 RepID=UPI000707F76A|nr:hypothetical protein [Acinetobacter baumannii]KQG47851.1 hypothetical protein APC40_05745 [Acinetobacter baumannii]MDP7806905.1 hypothetical protein [Acinetobacter baumannii]MDP7860791.1 hypothetical protein [Acinetobacter baumannii]MDP7880321.1 hypothetical protein [Acinetobacter baumannii]